MRRGMTLVELLVVLVILAVMATVSSVALGGMGTSPPPSWRDSVAALRSRAIRTGRVEVLTGAHGTVRALPDGRLIGDSIDPLTGVERVAAP